MAANQKRRFIVVGGVVVLVVVCLLAFLGAGGSAEVMTVAQASEPDAAGKRVEVTGNVVNNSFAIEGDVLTFHISDPDEPGTDLAVEYDQGVSATFGNGVTAICTGTIRDDGTLQCSELVTKCPSKYETSTDALTVERLLGYGAAIYDKTVKVTGAVKAGTLADATADVRFTLEQAPADGEGGEGEGASSSDADPAVAQAAAAGIPVKYVGALSDAVVEGAEVVLTGSLGADGTFTATEVALEG